MRRQVNPQTELQTLASIERKLADIEEQLSMNAGKVAGAIDRLSELLKNT